MNGTIRISRSALGAVAVLALAAGCSRNRQPAQQPTPTFESRVSEPAAPAAQEPGYQQAPTQPEMAQPGATQPGMQGGMNQPGMQGQPGMTGTTPGGTETGAQGAQPGGAAMGGTETTTGAPGPAGAATGMSEREMCDALTRDATLRVEDIQGGVAIVLTPKAGTDLSTVRDDARHVERMMTPEGNVQGGAAPTPSEGERCMLFDLGRQGARAVVSEAPNSIRILFTSSDTQSLKTIRKQARDFAKSGKAGGPGGKTRGTQKPSGGSQSPSGGSQTPSGGGTTP